MSKFTEEDWAGLAGGGNEAFNSLYLARFNSRDHPLPNSGTDINKLKDFIRQKYIDKKWHADGAHGGGVFSPGPPSAAASGSSSTASTVEDSSKISIKLNSRPVSQWRLHSHATSRYSLIFALVSIVGCEPKSLNRHGRHQVQSCLWSGFHQCRWTY